MRTLVYLEDVNRTLQIIYDSVDETVLEIENNKEYNESDFVRGCVVGMKWVKSLLMKGVDPNTNFQWIPTSERLPKEKDGKVLVTQNNEVREAQYSEFSNTWYYGDFCSVGGNDPTAWMPKPKPYKGE